MNNHEWSIEGSKGNPIYGSTNTPEGTPRGVVLIAHGYMGYKEYGMFPWLAEQCAALGYRAHRFNFSHSGMLPGDGPFEREDLFEQATWNRQVEDLEILASSLKKPDIPFILFGHSRGGVSTLLALGRGAVVADGAIVLSSPSSCLTMAKEQEAMLVANGRLETASGRTGQTLHVGKRFVEEQRADPQGHDLLALARNITLPVLIMHGDADPTVPPSCARDLDAALPQSTVALIPGGDHVCNTPNPFAITSQPSEQLLSMWSSLKNWLPLT